MSLASLLGRLGFTDAELDRRLALFAVARSASVDACAWYHVPGRIEVLGKHTDYAGGRSLVCATEQGLAAEAGPRADRVVRVIDAVTQEVREFPVDPALVPPRGDWANYPMTVVARLAQDFGAVVGGFDLAFASDIPIAAGVSSSSAVVVAVAKAAIDLFRLDQTEAYRAHITSLEDLAGYLGAVENGRSFRGFGATAGVGTLGGNQDHTAILCSASDALTQVRFDPVAVERRVAWPDDFRFVIASSGVVAEKTGPALERYNRLARMTERLRVLVVGPDSESTLGRAIIDRRVTGLPAGADLDPDEALRLNRRLTQLTAECRVLIPGVVDALGKREFVRLGELVAASQLGAEIGLENQIPETMALVESARRLGAVAASAFGAGFGGSVWAMVQLDRVEQFAEAWGGEYRRSFPDRSLARFLTTRPAPAASGLAEPSGRRHLHRQ